MRFCGIYAAVLTVASSLFVQGNAEPHDVAANANLSPSDEYVNFGATLMELVLATRHVDRNEFKYQGALGLEKELEIERIKIEWSKTLRNNFRNRYPDIANKSQLSVEEEYKIIPYFLSADVANILQKEGFKTPLTSANLPSASDEELSKFASGRDILATRNRRRLEGKRELFSFPILCTDEESDCATEYLCWGISQAIDGLNMEETCNLLEKIQGVSGGTWTLDDWLKEIPGFINAVKDVKSIAGIISLANCGAAATSFDRYTKYGDEAVFYYPKAMCEAKTASRGCMYELAIILQLALVKPVVNFIPENVVEIIEQIRDLLVDLYIQIPSLCLLLSQIDLLDGNAIQFLEKWESLFDVVKVGAGEITKLELLLKVLTRLTNFSLLSSYLPTLPKGCEAPLADVGQTIYNDVFQGGSDDVPTAICDALGPSNVQTCLNGVLKSIDKVDWIAESLGNGNLHKLTEQVIPNICDAMTDVNGLEVSELFEQIPLILKVYVDLGLDILESVLPGVHNVVVECGEEFAQLIEDTGKALEDSKTKSLIKLVCSDRFSNNKCMVKLSDGLDQLSFAADALGKGTLKLVITQSVPDACSITEKIIDLEGDDESIGGIDLSSVISQLPNIITWYETLSEIEVFKSMLPQWPRASCSHATIETIAGDLSYGIEHTDYLPQKICTLTQEKPSTCLLAFGASLEESDLVRSIFNDNVAEAGPKATIEALIKDILPSACEAVQGLSIDTADLIRAVPIILSTYAKLDIVPVQQLMPQVHDLLTDGICNRQFQKLSSWIAQVVDGTESDPVGGICKRISHNNCLKQLSNSIDTVSFIKEAIGEGTLALVVDDIVPTVCSSIRTAASDFDVENLIENLPALLDLVDKLATREGGTDANGQALYPLQAYIPLIPQDKKCRSAYHEIAREFASFGYDSDYKMTNLIDEICISWPRNDYDKCLISLGDSFDQVELIRDLVGSPGLLQTVAKTLLPSACEVIGPNSALIEWNSTGILESLPVIISWYESMQPNAPSFIKDYLPAFPSEACPPGVIALFQDRVGKVTEGEGIDVSLVLKASCSLSQEEIDCLVGLGDSIDQVPVLTSAVGFPEGMIQNIVSKDLEKACTIIGDEFDTIHYGNLVAKIPELLRFLTSLRSSLPSFAAAYIPIIPHAQCDPHYNTTAQKFAEHLIGDKFDQLPAVLCDLTPEESECIALLGDAVDKVEMFRELLGGQEDNLIRYTMTTVKDYACSLFSSLSDLTIPNLATEIPKAFEILDTLNGYQILDSLLPDVPDSCQDEIPSLAKTLQGVVETTDENELQNEIPKALCKISDGTKECLGDFGLSFERVQWISDTVPNTHSIALDLIKLLPVVCDLLFQIKSSVGKDFSDPEVLLRYIPVVFSLFESLREVEFVKPYVPPITDECVVEFRTVVQSMSEKGLMGVPGVFCEMGDVPKQCIKSVGVELDQMEIYKGMIPHNLISDLVDTLPEACSLLESLGNFDYNSIVGSIPELLVLLAELNKIDAIREYIPDISNHCTEVYTTSLAPRFEKNGLSGLPRSICDITKPEEICIKDLVEDSLSIPMIGELASSQLNIEQGSIVTEVNSLVNVVFNALPSACQVVSSLEENAGTLTVADNVFLVIPKILDLLDELNSFSVLSPYVPNIDATCSAEYRKMVAPDGELYNVENILLLPSKVCTVMLETQPQIPQCLVKLGTEIDSLAFIGSSLNVEGILQVLVEVMPVACDVIDRVIQVPSGEIDFDAVFEVVPDLTSIYSSLQKSLPANLQSLAPPFPEKQCSTVVVTSISNTVKGVVTGEDDIDIPLLLCSGLSAEEKECLASLGDALDQVAFFKDMLGRPGLVRELTGEILDAVCTILGTPPEGGAVDATNLLGHFDTLLDVVRAAHRAAPDFVAEYLPEIPGGDCESIAYPRISLTLSDFTISKLCKMASNDLDIECLAKLGDNIETTPALVNLLYGDQVAAQVAKQDKDHKSLLRLLAEAIPNTICEARDEFGAFSFDNILSQIPEVFELIDKLWAYPMLRDFVPQVPESCENGIQVLVDQLLDPKEGVEAVLCNMSPDTKSCALNLAKNIEQTAWADGVAPNAHSLVESAFGLLPATCKIFSGDDFNTQDILAYIPDIMDLFFEVDTIALANGFYSVDVRPMCETELKSFAQSVSDMESLGSLPNVMCSSPIKTFECIKLVGANIEQLPVIVDTIPPGLVANLVTVFRDEACPILQQTDDMDLTAFVSAIPAVMELLGQLEQISFLQDYLPVISDECKATFGGPIADKIRAGIEFSETQGLISLGNNLDFSGLTSILCNYSVPEIACFKHVAKAVVNVDLLHDSLSASLPLQPNGEKYSLPGLIDVGFDVRDDACSLFDNLGKDLNFESIFESARDIIKITEQLNSFPVIHQYVPDFGATCVQAVENVTSYVTSDDPIRRICDINNNEKTCLIDIARKLDGISEVRFAYMFLSGAKGKYSSMEKTVAVLLDETLDNTCSIFEAISHDVDGVNLAHLVENIPKFLESLNKFAEIPFLSKIAPQLSESCTDALTEFAGQAATVVTESQGIQLVCSAPVQVKQCIIELDDKFAEVPMIGERIPKGLIRAFIASLDSGCPIVLHQDIDKEAFMREQLPILVVNTGTIAGVEEGCLGSLGDNTDDICQVDDTCLRGYMSKVSTLPLIGKFIPTWASDIVVDLCAVRTGDQTISDFMEKHLSSVVREVSKLDGITSECANNMIKVSDLMDQPLAHDVAATSCELLVSDDGNDCVGQLADSLDKSTFANLFIPDGVDELLRASCEFLGQSDRTIFGLLPELTPLLDVLAKILGYPSDDCGNQVDAVTTQLAQLNDFDSKVFCEGLSDECTSEVVLSVRGLPFVGHYLPDGTAQLIGASCAMVRDRSNYAALIEHIPTLFDIVGRIALGSRSKLDEECRDKIHTTLFDPRSKSLKFRPRYLCAVGDTCTVQLIDALQELPLVGQHIPDSVVGLLGDMCEILQDNIKGDAQLELSDDEDEALPQVLPMVFGLLGKIVGNQGESKRALLSKDEEHNCGNKLQEYGNNVTRVKVSELCSAIPGKCMILVSERLENIPIIKGYFPERLGELLATSCSVFNSQDDPGTVVRENLPNLLTSAAHVLNLDDTCAESVSNVGAKFKSQRGRLDGEFLCQSIPDQSCLEQVSVQIVNLPFVGAYLPTDVGTLIQHTCDLVNHDNLSFTSYFEEEGPVLLQLSGLVVGMDEICSQAFKQVEAISSTKSLCDQAGAACLDSLSVGLSSMPLVGQYLPDGIDDLFFGVCAFAENEVDWIEFASQTLPSVFMIVGKAATGDIECGYQLRTFGTISAQQKMIDVDAMCSMDAKCFELLVGGLETLPLWGPFLPKETESMIQGVCSIHKEHQEATKRQSEGEKLKHFLYQNMHTVVEFANNLVRVDSDCQSSFSQAAGIIVAEASDDQNNGGVVDVASIVCSYVPQRCIHSFVEGYRALPLFGQLVPEGADALFPLVCPLAGKSSKQVVTELFVPGGVIDQLTLSLPMLSAVAGGNHVCDPRIESAAKDPLAGTPDSWKTLFPCVVGTKCMGYLVDGVLSLPGMNSALQTEQSTIRSILVDQPCPTGPGPDDETEDNGSGDDEGDSTLGTAPSGESDIENVDPKKATIALSVLGVLIALTAGVVLLKLYCKGHKHRDLGKYHGKDDGTDRLDKGVSRAIIPRSAGHMDDGFDKLFPIGAGDFNEEDDGGDDSDAESDSDEYDEDEVVTSSSKKSTSKTRNALSPKAVAPDNNKKNTKKKKKTKKNAGGPVTTTSLAPM